MNSGSSLGVLALASIDSATSKVLASNWRLVTCTLSVSCGWVCSIRLCGARGFSKLRSLMYWPCMISGALGAWAGPGFGGEGGGVVVMAYFRCFGGGGTTQGCTAQGAGRCKGRAIAKTSPKDDDRGTLYCTVRRGNGSIFSASPGGHFVLSQG